MGVEITIAMTSGRAEFLVVEEFGKPLLNGFARGDFLQIGIGEFCLGDGEGASLCRIEIFHPAVRISDLRAVMILDEVSAAGGRIRERGCDGCDFERDEEEITQTQQGLHGDRMQTGM